MKKKWSNIFKIVFLIKMIIWKIGLRNIPKICPLKRTFEWILEFEKLWHHFFAYFWRDTSYAYGVRKKHWNKTQNLVK